MEAVGRVLRAVGEILGAVGGSWGQTWGPGGNYGVLVAMRAALEAMMEPCRQWEGA